MFTVRFNNSFTSHSSLPAALKYARKWTKFYALRSGNHYMYIHDSVDRFVCQVKNGYKVVIPCLTCGITRVFIEGASCDACCKRE